MSNAVFWGLTNKDFENVLWNGVTWLAVTYAGGAVGAIVTLASEKFLFPNDKPAGDQEPSISRVLGIVTGTIVASVSVANRLPFVEIAGKTAAKSFFIGIATFTVGALAARSIGKLVPAPSGFLASQSMKILRKMPGTLGLVPLFGAAGYFGSWILYVPAFHSVTGSVHCDKIYEDPSSFF